MQPISKSPETITLPANQVTSEHTYPNGAEVKIAVFRGNKPIAKTDGYFELQQGDIIWTNYITKDTWNLTQFIVLDKYDGLVDVEVIDDSYRDITLYPNVVKHLGLRLKVAA